MVEVPEDTYALEPDEHPPVCLECGDPIPRHKPVDAKFCSEAHRKRHHYRNRDTEAEDDTEAITRYYEKLPPLSIQQLPEDVAFEWQAERRFLGYSVNHNAKQKLRILQLEAMLLSGPDKLKNNPAYWAEGDQIEATRYNRIRGLMRSPSETEGSLRWTRTARTLANKRALIANHYDDPEDWFLDDRKDES